MPQAQQLDQASQLVSSVGREWEAASCFLQPVVWCDLESQQCTLESSLAETKFIGLVHPPAIRD